MAFAPKSMGAQQAETSPARATGETIVLHARLGERFIELNAAYYRRT